MFSCLWKMWNWLDPPTMDSKKSFTNQPKFINDINVNEHGQFGAIINSHPNAVQCAVRQTQQKNLMNKTTTVVYNQPQNQNQNHDQNQYVTKQITLQENNKKKSGGNQIQLRFPSTKRPPEAAITKQGWLHKQGAEGLKVWRKRWFVLSDYCLFYYKGPEEEKVLGSILLPSYKVSLCSSDSKVGRKFAFKCEHANMRTYYLAADSQESMNEWVEAIKLACMLQTNVESNVDRQSGPSLSSHQNQNTGMGNGDSSFQQPYTNPAVHPPHTYPKHAQPQPQSQSHLPQNYIGNFQPLYANAPPKPRRQNDGGYMHNMEYPPEMYSTPSNSSTPRYHSSPAAPQMQYNPNPNPNVQQHYCSRSPVNNIYRTCDNMPLAQYANHSQFSQNSHNLPMYYMHNSNGVQSSERRTPDTYGRSKQSKVRDVSDYEDIYTDEVMYKRPLSPIAYSNIKKISPVSTIPVLPIHRPYTLFNTAAPQRPTNFVQNNHIHTSKGRYHDGPLPNLVPRPHSADFLEYEFQQRDNDILPVNFQQPRPKSSLDITSSDSYYYSKESYADKMRKSSLYLQHYTAPRIVKPESQRPMFDTMPKTNFVPKSFSETHNISMLGGDITPPDACPSPYSKHIDPSQEILQHKRYYADNNNQLRDYLSQYSRDSSNTLDWSEKSSRSFQDTVPSHRDNERRREESMKRLLEWKQRMLQSPLNRKLPNHLARTDLYKQYPSVPNARQQSYANSYSSDDEENILDRKSKKEKVVQNKLSQAGRTTEGQLNDKFIITPSPIVNDTTTLSYIDKDKPVPQPQSKTPASREESYTKQLPEPQTQVKASTPTNGSNKSSRTTKEDTPTRELSLNISAISSLIADVTVTPKGSPNIVEENYLPMTPKKSILDPNYLQNNIKTTEIEENAYIEMCRGLTFLDTKDSNVTHDNEPYEIFNFSHDKIEPVYMEVNSSLTDSIHKDKDKDDCGSAELKTNTNVQSQSESNNNNKSDTESADADDEASKDLDSLDTPFHPRFSLSDTFRPASYYLGASQVFTEFQDSSDSELVSPPPIPTSPPLTDDLENSYTQNTSNNECYNNIDNSDDNLDQNQSSKKFGYLSADNLKQQQQDNNSSFNFELDKQIKSQSFNNDCELMRNSPYYKQNGGSEDFCNDELASLDSSSKVNDYLTSKLSDITIQEKGSPLNDYENMCITTENKSVTGYKLYPNHSVESSQSSSHKYSYTPTVLPVDFVQRLYDPNLDVTTSSDIIGLLPGVSSARSTPSLHTNSSVSIQDLEKGNYGAPYYCSDLLLSDRTSPFDRTLTLPMNNQRSVISLKDNHTRKDITRIKNPIGHTISAPLDNKSNNNTFKLAVEARSVSMEFLNLADKNGQIDRKNIYESDTLKRAKALENSQNEAQETNNNNDVEKIDEKNYEDSNKSTTQLRRSHSLEDKLDKDKGKDKDKDKDKVIFQNRDEEFLITTEELTRDIWEEDTLWTNRLRTVSRRHTRSLDDLDDIANEALIKMNKKQTKKVTRGVTYVNDNIAVHLRGTTKQPTKENEVNTITRTNPQTNLLIDRETLRQWDLLSSAPSDVTGSNAGSRLSSVTLGGTDLSTNKNKIPPTQIQNSTNENPCTLSNKPDEYFSEIRPSSSSEQSTPLVCTPNNTRSQNVVYGSNHTGLYQKGITSVNSMKGSSLQSKSKEEQIYGINNKKENLFLHAGQNEIRESFQSQEMKRLNRVTPFGPSSGDNISDVNSVVDIEKTGRGVSKNFSYSSLQLQHNAKKTASGSICLNTNDTFPRDKDKRIDAQYRSFYNMVASNEDCYMPSSHSVQDLNLNAARRGQHWNNVSAGELLGRTHEELVLLLIQLRRQSTNTCHAIEACYQEIDEIQLQLNGMDPQRRLESLKKLEQLKQHLLDLEKQYEKGKPLVNLVDNMVKLGSLYRSPNDQGVSSYVRDRLEFNQQMQEKRLLAEEKRDWNRLSPNHVMLQTKVQQLYQLDKLLQEESETLQALQYDKEKIERALGNLRYKLNVNPHNHREFEQARKQQLILEKELSKVHQMLAYNSKKLEETVAGNARLEQELLVLRQKLQTSSKLRNSPQFSSAGDSLPCATSSSALLESELHRVQQLVGDLQRHRQELSLQVRQLTDRSHNLSEQVYSPPVSPVQSLYSVSANNKKRNQTYWRETDLDTMQSIDHGINNDMPYKTRSTLSLYDDKSDNYSYYVKPSSSCSQISNEDQNIGGNLQEKQEIKTVRIVKRESERRQRDREKSGSYGGLSDQLKWDSLMEESDMNTNPFQMPVKDNDPINREPPITDQMLKYFSPVNCNSSSVLNGETSVSTASLPQTKSYSSHSLTAGSVSDMDKSPVLSPVFKSKAARQIINEMSGQQNEEPTVKCSIRRLIPKEKRRHYTAPNNSLIKSMNQLSSTEDETFSGLESYRRRARDDLDMERALRQRTDTPDVVRSTLSNKELKYNENTIESLLGTPNKISIPERYIPEKLPQLSPEEEQHRLRKVESIKRMLTDTTIISQNQTNKGDREKSNPDGATATSKIVEEKKQREHLLQLNQILAKQVMEMSKIVAVKALASLPLEESQKNVEEDDLSPVMPLPLYQQRDNFYT